MMELIRGHVFEAANKRTGYTCAVTFPDEHGYVSRSSEEEAESLTTKTTIGEADVDEIAEWLRKHARKRQVL
jgi:death-on-curing family protein